MLRIFDFIDGLNLDVALMRAETALYVAKEEALNYTPSPEKHSVPKTELETVDVSESKEEVVETKEVSESKEEVVIDSSEALTELKKLFGISNKSKEEVVETKEVSDSKEEVVETKEVSESKTEETNSEFVNAMVENIIDGIRSEALSTIESDTDKELMNKIFNDILEKSNVKEVLCESLSEVEKSLEEDVDKENAAKENNTSEELVNSENNETVVAANTTPENPSPTNPVLSVLGNNNPNPVPMPAMNPNGAPMMNPNPIPMPAMNSNPMPMNPTPTTNPALEVLANNPALCPSLHAPVMPMSNPFRQLKPAANPDDVLIDPRIKDLIAGVIYEDGSIGLDMSNLIIKDEDEPKIFTANNSVRESVNRTTLADVKNLIANAEANKKEMKGKRK